MKIPKIKLPDFKKLFKKKENADVSAPPVTESEDGTIDTGDSSKTVAPTATSVPKEPFGKKIKRFWHEWWYGTKEKPRHPYSWRSRLVRWFLLTFRGYVKYITTMYDTKIDEIRYDLDIIKKKDLPKEAVHVTKQKKTYHLDMDLPIRGFDATKDYGFTASSAFNYMKNNAMSDAMVYDTDSFKPEIDKSKLLLYCAIGFGIFMAMYLVVIPMYT